MCARTHAQIATKLCYCTPKHVCMFTHCCVCVHVSLKHLHSLVPGDEATNLLCHTLLILRTDRLGAHWFLWAIYAGASLVPRLSPL